MEIQLKNGVYFLSGRMDENSNFDVLAKATEPLKLNIGRVVSINSIGVRRFLSFTMSWSPRKFEFYECTPEFIANVNVIPQMLGVPGDEKQIKSFYVPFSCEACKRVENVLFERDQIKLNADGEVALQARRCDKCAGMLDLDVDRAEYFVFLQSDSSS